MKIRVLLYMCLFLACKNGTGTYETGPAQSAQSSPHPSQSAAVAPDVTHFCNTISRVMTEECQLGQERCSVTGHPEITPQEYDCGHGLQKFQIFLCDQKADLTAEEWNSKITCTDVK